MSRCRACLVSRYSGRLETAPLHELGSGQWAKAKEGGAASARRSELLNLYAQRSGARGHAFKFDVHDYEAFAAGFGFEETPDQAAAIEAVIGDLTSASHGQTGMRRRGRQTEVALRAAFVAVADGKQVAASFRRPCWSNNTSDLLRSFRRSAGEARRAVSVPLRRRGQDRVEGSPRDRSIWSSEPTSSFSRMSNSSGWDWSSSTEHRFGVRQKERLKRLAKVDVYAHRHADPRTLAMSLEGCAIFGDRHCPGRLAIKTFVSQYSSGIVREAALRELQSAAVRSIFSATSTPSSPWVKGLPRWCPRRAWQSPRPDARARVGARDATSSAALNLLLCSTIIETGIDVRPEPSSFIAPIDSASRSLTSCGAASDARITRRTPVADAAGSAVGAGQEAPRGDQLIEAGIRLLPCDARSRDTRRRVLGDEQSGGVRRIGFSSTPTCSRPRSTP